MNKTLTRSALLFSTAISLGFALPAYAEHAPADQSVASNPGDIIVTARRIEERLQDVPISITVMNQQQLANHNVVNAQDLAAYTPSLSVNNDFGADNSTFAIRGFVQDAGTAPSVGVYFGDVVAPRGGSVGFPSGDGAGPGSFFDLQNVQVLKGPQGTLQGVNTTGGAVMLVPQKPTHKLEGYVEGSAGNYNMQRLQAVLNVPLGDNLRMRLGVDHQSRSGYLINDSGIGPKDLNNVMYTAARFSLVADLTPNLENYTIASYNYSHNNGNTQKIIGVTNPAQGYLASFSAPQMLQEAAQGFYHVQQSEPDAGSLTKQWQVINATTWHASDNLTVKNIISYAELRQALNQQIFGTNYVTGSTPASMYPFINYWVGAINASLPPAYQLPTAQMANMYSSGALNALLSQPGVLNTPFNFAAIHVAPGLDSTAQSTFTEEFRLTGNNLGGKLNWQAGAYYETSKPLGDAGVQTPAYTACGNIATTINPTCTYPLDLALQAYSQSLGMAGTLPFYFGGVNYQVSRSTFEDIGLYAQGTYALTSKLKLTGGLRYTWDKQNVTSTLVEFGAPTLVTNGFSQTLCTENLAASYPAGCNVAGLQKSHAPTWLIDIDYKPVDDVMLYAKWARGYRTGGVKVDIIPQFNTFQPEKVDTYEVGMKSAFHSAVSGVFNVSAFYNDFRNQQIQMGILPLGVPQPPMGGPLNLGKSRIWGIEADTTVNLFKGFTVNAGYTYLNTKVLSLATVTAPPGYLLQPAFQAGGPLSLSPKNKLTITGTYTLPLDESIGRISLSATLTHTDSMHAAYDSGYIAAGVYIAGPNGALVQTNADLGLLAATNLLDLNVNWNSVAGKPLDLSFFATNVTNQHYYTFVSGALGAGAEFANVGTPSMYGMRAKVHF